MGTDVVWKEVDETPVGDLCIDLVLHRTPDYEYMPGHEYLAVSKALYAVVMGKDNVPTTSSYDRDTMWLLEVDDAALKFVETLAKREGAEAITVEFHEVDHQDRQALLRDAAKGCPCMNEKGGE